MLLLHDVAPKKMPDARDHTKPGPHRIRTKLSGEMAAIPQAGQFSAVNWAFKTSVFEESPARRLDSSHSGSSSASMQRGKVLLRFGQPESFRSELIRFKSQAHRLIGMGPRRTQGGHHFNSAIHKLFEVETSAPVVSHQIESRDKGIQ